MGSRERDVDVARLVDRLAAVHRLDARERARALLEQPRDAEQVEGALRWCEVRPGFERATGGLDRPVDVDRVRFGDLGELFLGRRVDGRESHLAVGFDHLSADEKAIGSCDVYVIDRPRCGCVLYKLLATTLGISMFDPPLY